MQRRLSAGLIQKKMCNLDASKSIYRH